MTRKIQTDMNRTVGGEVHLTGTLYGSGTKNDGRMHTVFTGHCSESGIGMLVLYPDVMDDIGVNNEPAEIEYEVILRKKHNNNKYFSDK